MLDMEYKKDIYGNYLVIEAVPDTELTYGMKMHLNNKIKGVLDVELHITNDKKEFYYNVTSKETIACFLDKEQLKYNELQQILREIVEYQNI